MKAHIDVKDRAERDAIISAMTRPDVRAFVVMMGILHALPSDRARARALRFVWDKFDEDHALAEESSRA